MTSFIEIPPISTEMLQHAKRTNGWIGRHTLKHTASATDSLPEAKKELKQKNNQHKLKHREVSEVSKVPAVYGVKDLWNRLVVSVKWNSK